MTEQYQCQSYSDDNHVVQDCTCGKCGNTPDTEFDSDKEVVGSDCLCVLESKKHNPECEYATPDAEWERTRREVEIELRTNYVVLTKEQLAKHDVDLLTSRDNYWRERVDRVLIAMSWREENETSEAIRVLAEIRERLVVTNEDNLK